MEIILNNIHFNSILNSLIKRSFCIQQNNSSLLNHLITLNSKQKIKEEKEKLIQNLNYFILNDQKHTYINEYIALMRTEIENIDNSISQNNSLLERLDLCEIILDNIIKNKNISVNKSIEYEYVSKTKQQNPKQDNLYEKLFTRAKNSLAKNVNPIPQQKNKETEEKDKIKLRLEVELLKKEVEKMFNKSIYEHNRNKQNENNKIQVNLPQDITDSFIKKLIKKKGQQFITCGNVSQNDNKHNNSIIDKSTIKPHTKYCFKPKNRSKSSLKKNKKKNIELSPVKPNNNTTSNIPPKQNNTKNILKKNVSQVLHIKQILEVPKILNLHNSKSFCSELRSPLFKLIDDYNKFSDNRKYITLRIFSRSSLIKYIQKE